MNYIDYEEKLEKTVRGLPQEAQVVFSELPVISMMEQIGGGFNLTMGEIGEMCELVRQVITQELEPKDFEAGLAEKLDEENREKVPDIVVVLSQALFSMLLPALNIKIPIELAVRVAPPKVEGLEIPPLAPAHPAQMKKVAPPSASVPPPSVTGSVLHQNYQVPTTHPTYQDEALIKPNLKPPLMETSHESMAVNPLESLIQMLEGKVSQKDLSRQFEKLPESLKNALGSVDSAKKVVDIGRKYALHMDKLGELGAETGMVILGFTHPGEFLSRLTKKLGLPEEKVRPIAQEINTEVFLKIREALKVVHGENEEQKTPTVTTASAPVPPPPSQLSGIGGEKLGGQAQAISTSPIPIKKPESDLGPSETEEVLDREAILRDIENPVPINFGPQTVIAKTPNRENPGNFGAGTKVSALTSVEPKNIPIKPEGKIQLPTPTITAAPPQKIVPILNSVPSIIPPDIKPIPKPLISEISPPSQLSGVVGEKLAEQAKTSPAKPQNIIDQKLSGATSSAKSESSYTADPYREAVE